MKGMHWVTKIRIKTGILFRDFSVLGVSLTTPFHYCYPEICTKAYMYFSPIDLYSGDYLNKINPEMADFQAFAVVEVGWETGSLSLLPFACCTCEYHPRPSGGTKKTQVQFPSPHGKGESFRFQNWISTYTVFIVFCCYESHLLTSLKN